MKYALCGLKDKLQNQLRHKRQPKVLLNYGFSVVYSTIWAALFQSIQQFSTIHVQSKKFLKSGLSSLVPPYELFLVCNSCKEAKKLVPSPCL